MDFYTPEKVPLSFQMVDGWKYQIDKLITHKYQYCHFLKLKYLFVKSKTTGTNYASNTKNQIKTNLGLKKINPRHLETPRNLIHKILNSQ
jgi:hypothetical protein